MDFFLYEGSYAYQDVKKNEKKSLAVICLHQWSKNYQIVYFIARSNCIWNQK